MLIMNINNTNSYLNTNLSLKTLFKIDFKTCQQVVIIYVVGTLNLSKCTSPTPDKNLSSCLDEVVNTWVI